METKLCFECGNPAIHEHHVVPQVHGGTKTVPLCGKCHGLIHDRNFLNWRELQRAGIEAAKAAGISWGGRKPGTRITVTEEKETVVREMHAANEPIAEIARATGLSRQTIYRVLDLWHRT